MYCARLRWSSSAPRWMPTACPLPSKPSVPPKAPAEAIAGKQGEELDPTALEGLTGKSYAIPNKRIAQIYVKGPAMLGYWRSVGNSLNDFFYEAFLDELADQGGRDPYELRLHLLRDNPRLTTLLQSGGRVVRRLEAWPLHRRRRHAPSAWRGHGLAVWFSCGGDRRGVD